MMPCLLAKAAARSGNEYKVTRLRFLSARAVAIAARVENVRNPWQETWKQIFDTSCFAMASTRGWAANILFTRALVGGVLSGAIQSLIEAFAQNMLN